MLSLARGRGPVRWQGGSAETTPRPGPRRSRGVPPFDEDQAPGLEAAVIGGTSRALQHGLDGLGRGRGLTELQRRIAREEKLHGIHGSYRAVTGWCSLVRQ